MKDVILHITEDLVRIKTTADRPDELNRCVDFVEQFFQGTEGLFINRYTCAGKPAVVISTQETFTPDILLVGHIDVVPAPDELFEPRYEGTKLFARGSCDMKSECAVLMLLLKEFAQQSHPPSLALMLTSDEEIGGLNGVNYLVNEVGYRCKIALIPDGGQSPDDIVLQNKGVLLLRMTAKGKTGHGSRPWLGENAIEKLLSAYARVRTLFPNQATATDFWYHTLNIGMISGGEAANQIPGSASCDLDIRFTPDVTAQALLEQITACVGNEVCVEMRVNGDPIFTDPQDPFVQLYASCVEENLGTPATFNKHCGSNDGRFFTSLGIPIIVSRPTSGDQHSPHEWLETESLVDFYEICFAFIQKFNLNIESEKT
ncbi:M20/M25/M40 family metallo-hydrolase [Candidatus Uhrbacteria bacterium]|nr:M20/M25/M40 family metallo-hydrolase [Candidatus Uhrbacteria bacterium]